MLEHSIKVPRSYKAAAKILKTSKLDGKGIKNVLYDVGAGQKNLKMIYALVMETMKRFDNIDKMMKESELLMKEPGLDPWLARILIMELVWRKQTLPGDSKPIKTVLAYEAKLRALASDDVVEEVKVNIPRYVRVNTLKMSTQEAVDKFRDGGWTLIKHLDRTDYSAFIDKVSNLQQYEFMVDMHLEDVLIFPPYTEFFKHEAYLENLIILQDKASCLPVKLLNAPPGSTVLDMCAAPGNKTTQIAASLQDQGVVYAVERSKDRKSTLDKIVQSSGATCVQTLFKDVLNVKGEDVPGVEYILVDPSCSGSGIKNRVDSGGGEDLKQRLRKLANFQILILKHAMRSYPDVKRIVYSTCSIYPEENEEVIHEVLKNNPHFKLISAASRLKAPWVSFGEGEVGQRCLYSRPETDLANGFFVGVLERLQEGEVNEFLQQREFVDGKVNNKRGAADGGESKPQKRIKRAKGGNEDFESYDTPVTEETPLNKVGETFSSKKSKKKNKKRELDEIQSSNQCDLIDEKASNCNGDGDKARKKKNKKKKNVDKESDVVQQHSNESELIKDQGEEEASNNGVEEKSTKKKNKKKRNADKETQDLTQTVLEDAKTEEATSMKKDKKNRKKSEEANEVVALLDDREIITKKKKRVTENALEESNAIDKVDMSSAKEKKKKKKAKNESSDQLI